MDVALTPAKTVKARIASAWLESSLVSSTLGSITLAAHQLEAAVRVCAIIRQFGGALLADEAGMGKTYVALAVARDYRAITVVAPASLRAMWAEASAFAKRTAEFMSFESLSRRGVDPAPADSLIIVDEAHHVRNPRTRRYDALSRLTMGPHVLLLSATPIHNRVDDLRNALALFLGAQADRLREPELSRLVVRRGHLALSDETRLPALNALSRLPVPRAPAVLHAIGAIPPPVPPADGGAAIALVRLGLLRAWASSNAALRTSLRRRLQHAGALTHALEAGRFPTREELAAWTTLDDAVQLAFPTLVAGTVGSRDVGGLLEAIARHCAGVHGVLSSLDAAPDGDGVRVAHLREIRNRHPGSRIVAFTQFAETARALFQRMRTDPGVALVTAAGARIASGTMRRCEIIARFARPPDVRDDPRLPLFLLIATDVVSEGLNLQGASVLVHLDLPWTPARIEQRVGRVRRLGAEHALVNVYAIAPPAHELSTVLRALQRKSRIVSALGIPASHSQRELLGSERHPMHRATKEAGLTDLVEAVRSLLRTWMIPAEDAALVASGLPICCGLCGRSPRAGWQALVLAETGGRPRLAALSPVGLDEHPREILRVARLVTTATEPQGARCSRELRAARSAAVLAGRQWVAELRGSALAAPALDASSLAHAKALRRIAVLMLRAPRHERSALADVASRCRLLLRTARGSGVERALTNWLETPAASLAMMPPSARVQLDALATLLRPFGGSTRIGEVNAALHALIVLVRA